MKNIINITENNNILKIDGNDNVIVCGNSNYMLKFNFSDKWQKCIKKMALFIINGKKITVDFEGSECDVPVLPNAFVAKLSIVSGIDDLEFITTSVDIKLEPTITGDNFLELNQFENYLSNVLGAINKIKSGEIVAKNAEYAQFAESASFSESSSSSNVAKNVINSNILINGDFRVNQRGLKNYTEHNKYTVDRWNLNYGSLTVNDDGSITHTATNTWQGIRQYIEFPSRLAGKTLTFSMKSSSDGVRLVQISCLRKGNTTTDKLASKQENDITSEIMTFSVDVPADITDEDKLFILLYTPQANQSITYYWTKLEIGTSPTEFIPRLYAEELALCQRYYLELKHNGGVYNLCLGYGVLRTDGLRVQAFFAIPSTLRTIPTITLKGMIGIVNMHTNTLKSNPEFKQTLYCLLNNAIGIQFTATSTLGNGGDNVLLFSSDTSSKIILDAEIY